MHEIHDTSPSAAAASGRALMATALMGAMLKEEKDRISATILARGEIGRIIATSDASSRVKCDIENPHTTFRLNDKGKIDVAGIVDGGALTVIRSQGDAAPYVGQTPIVSGEIAEDFAHYFAVSEQTPSIVALGVFVDSTINISHAGGYIIQTMPGVADGTLDKLENKASTIGSVTEMLRGGMTCRDIADEWFSQLGEYRVLRSLEPEYRCDCSRERIERSLMSLGSDELNSIVDDGETIECICHFCRNKYYFTVDEVREILREATSDD
jgi:molecular chaperone Hsp33